MTSVTQRLGFHGQTTAFLSFSWTQFHRGFAMQTFRIKDERRKNGGKWEKIKNQALHWKK